MVPTPRKGFIRLDLCAVREAQPSSGVHDACRPPAWLATSNANRRTTHLAIPHQHAITGSGSAVGVLRVAVIRWSHRNPSRILVPTAARSNGRNTLGKRPYLELPITAESSPRKIKPLTRRCTRSWQGVPVVEKRLVFLTRLLPAWLACMAPRYRYTHTHSSTGPKLLEACSKARQLSELPSELLSSNLEYLLCL